jgi:Rad3-related DNA helicase
LKVRFPFDPRHSYQDDITKTILNAIKHNKPCLVESPTGTGKTLCLLTACLSCEELYPVVHKVFYLTRTHSQMACIVKQFNSLKDAYNVKFALQQSKKGLCGNPAVLKKGRYYDYEKFDDLCAEATDRGSEKAFRCLNSSSKFEIASQRALRVARENGSVQNP